MIRLALRVSQEQAELVLAELLELAPSGVEETSLPGGVVEYAVYGSPGELPALPDLRAAAGEALVEITTSEIADDWAERWREFHQPLVLGRELTVRPPWTPPGETAIDLVIDPGQAFGTGAHATTRLCLELLLTLGEPAKPTPLVDLGCGSGVLAILAARRGFHPVTALDFDPLAVEATQVNAERNGVELTVERWDLRSDPVPPGPVMLANLLGPLLHQLAGAINPAAAPEVLIASGLLVEEADDVARAFGRSGLTEVRRESQGEWSALLCRRTGT